MVAKSFDHRLFVSHTAASISQTLSKPINVIQDGIPNVGTLHNAHIVILLCPIRQRLFRPR